MKTEGCRLLRYLEIAASEIVRLLSNEGVFYLPHVHANGQTIAIVPCPAGNSLSEACAMMPPPCTASCSSSLASLKASSVSKSRKTTRAHQFRAFHLGRKLYRVAQFSPIPASAYRCRITCAVAVHRQWRKTENTPKRLLYVAFCFSCSALNHGTFSGAAPRQKKPR